VDGIAILAGGCVTHIASEELIKTLSGAVFIIFGLLLIFRNKKEGGQSEHHLGNPFYSGFILIFVSEWGDKTQIAAGLLATRYDGLMVLVGVMMASAIPVGSINACGQRADSLYFRKHLYIMQRNTNNNPK
jgi:putative Ca2+/H+ antiporter (TMEM165/GDT1 family)